MARETANNLPKQITPHLIGRLTDADLWTSCGTLLPVKSTVDLPRESFRCWMQLAPCELRHSRVFGRY